MTDSTRNGAWRWLAAASFVALAVRVAYALKVGDGVVWPDEAEYHGIALHWLQGNGYSYFRGIDNALSPTMYRAPGLPALLSGLYYLFGPSLLIARLAQAVLGAALVPVCFFLSRALGFGKRAVILACLVVAVYPYYIFCAGAVYPIVLSTILLGLANLALLKGRAGSGVGWEAIGGALLGLTTLTFGHVLGAAPLVALWVVFSKRAGRVSGVVAAAVLLLTLCATLAPWIVRNAVVMGKPGLSTAFEYNLCLGNAPGARWDSGSRISELESPDLKARVAKLSEADAARVYRDVALEQIKAQPGRFVALSLGKAANFWRLYPKPAARSVSLVERLVGLLTYGPVLVLACLWIAANRHGSGAVWLLLSYPITAMLLAAVTVSVDRYRLPFDVYLIILASAAVGVWLDRRNPQSAK